MNLRQLGALLEPSACVYGIDSVHVWRAGAANNELSVTDLARLYAEHMLVEFPELDDYRLGGWSFGGLVAVEISRYLRQLGHQVSAVLAIDSASPGTALLRASAELHPDASLDAITRQHLLEMGHDTTEIGALLADQSEGSFLNRLGATLRSHLGAASQHVMQAYDGALTLILAEQGTALDAPSRQAWHDMSAGLAKEVLIPGTHWSILRTPAVSRLAAEIAVVLVGQSETANNPSALHGVGRLA